MTSTLQKRSLALRGFAASAAVIVLFTSTVLAVDEKRDAEIGVLISQLESKDFRARQTATRQLRKIGRSAIGPLLERVRGGRLELGVRAMSIFEAAYTGRDEPAAAAADEALEELAVSKRQELAEHALAVLSRNSSVRTRRAVQNLKKLGGVIHEPERQSPLERARFRNDDVPYLVLDDEWKGGVNGLKYVRRLEGTNFQIYLSKGVPIDEKTLVELESFFEYSKVNRRGAVMLGIKGDRAREGNGVLVTEAVEGACAHDAGIRDGDAIVEMDGVALLDFDDLIQKLKVKKPAEKIVLTVIRDGSGKREDCKVTLGKWRPVVTKEPSAAKVKKPAAPAPSKK